jgi:hypothetical protein
LPGVWEDSEFDLLFNKVKLSIKSKSPLFVPIK